MQKNAIKEKSYAIALDIVKICRVLSEEQKEFVLSKQLMGSGASIGALYREAQQAKSTKYFIHKLAVAQKVCNETSNCLDILLGSDLFNSESHNGLRSKALELMRLLTSIIKTTKSRLTN